MTKKRRKEEEIALCGAELPAHGWSIEDVCGLKIPADNTDESSHAAEQLRGPVTVPEPSPYGSLSNVWFTSGVTDGHDDDEKRTPQTNMP